MRYNHDDRIDTYTNWQQAQKIPINRGFFIGDLTKVEVAPWEHKGGLGAFVNLDGAGGRNVNFELAGNVMGSHISEFPVGRYKKAHRHGPGAHVIILGGQGYSLLWPPNDGEMVRVDWQPGSVVVPPNQWFHQHFNSGADPARYLALRWNSWRYRFVALTDEKPIEVDVKQGGGQIEYEDEDPKIHQIFESALAKAGAPCHMGSMVQWCTQKERASA